MANKTGQTKRLLKVLNANDCCPTCPPLSQDAGNAAECRDDGLYVPTTDVPDTVNPEADDSSQSRFLFTESTPDTFTFDGVKARNINNKNAVQVYRMPDGNITSQFDDFTANDAMASATITNVGGFDNIVVGGSTAASYLRFRKQNTLNRFTYKFKVRIDAIGATAPLMGIRLFCPGGPYYNFCNTEANAYINLATGVITETNPNGVPVTYNGWLGTAAVGDIIEMTYNFTMREGLTVSFYNSNKDLGEISTKVRPPLGNYGDYLNGHQPSLVLADGTYTVLDFQIIASDYKPKVLLMGDSMSCGARIEHADTIHGSLESKIPYRVACTGATAQRIQGIFASLWAVRELQPEYVVLVSYLNPVYEQAANPADADYTQWNLDIQRLVGMIKAMGSKVIFVHPESWTFIANAAQSLYYTNYLNSTFPSDMKILVPTAQSFYDGTGFHYAGATNSWIADEIISLIETDGGF